jgi:Ankyrin repeats (3 copies)/Ankyrin repeat
MSITAAKAQISYTTIFYGQLNNKINLQMTLTRQGSNLLGSYFYTAIGTPIRIEGSVDVNESFVISEFDSSGKKTGVFKGAFKDDEMSGTWSSPDGLKAFPFLLRINHNLLQHYIDLIAFSPKEAATGLKTLSSPTAKAYLAYLYFIGKASVSNPSVEINRLIREAVYDIADGHIRDAVRERQNKSEYPNLGDLIWEIRFISEEDTADIMAPCWLFREHPKEALEAFGAYWGTSRDAVVFAGFCDESIEKIKPVKQLTGIVYDIQQRECSFCDGTVRFLFYRNWMMADLKAYIAPQLLIEDDVALLDEQPQRMRFLEIWSNMGLWNKEKYDSLVAAIPMALEGLKSYYAPTFGMDIQTAEKASQIAIGSVLSPIFSYFDEQSELDISISETPVYKAFTNPHLDVAQATRVIASPTLQPAKIPSEEEMKKYMPISHWTTSEIIKHQPLDLALKYAVLNNLSLDIIRLLVENGARANVGEESALMMAVKRPEVIRYLLQNGVDPNYQNSFVGKTALFYAVQYNALESAKTLLEKGADVNHALKTRDELIDLAMELGFSMDIFAVDAEKTPLVYAAMYASLPLIRLLVEHGADAHRKNGAGKQAVDYLEKNFNLSKSDQEQARKLLTRPVAARHLPKN